MLLTQPPRRITSRSHNHGSLDDQLYIHPLLVQRVQVKDLMPVVLAKDEERRIGEERGVITSWRRRAAERRARLILQCCRSCHD